MDDHVFEQLRSVIRNESGISLSPEKKTLLLNRLNKRLRVLGLNSPREYIDVLKNDDTGNELLRLIDAVSTNVTHFYREAEHYKILQEMFHKWVREGKRSIRVWCSASSSGEEPYNLAIIAAENLPLNQMDVKILATDICLDVLRRAIKGVYHEKQFNHMPAQIKAKYFSKVSNGAEPQWQINPRLKDLIVFKRLNLATFPYALKGPIDVIFCRNVMIYFELDLRKKITGEFSRLLASGGALFISR